MGHHAVRAHALRPPRATHPRPLPNPSTTHRSIAHVGARWLGSVLSDGRVRIHDMTSLGVVGEVDALRGAAAGSDATIRDAVFMPSDPTKLWTARSDGEIACWDTRCDGGPVRALRVPARKGADAEHAGPFSLAVNAGGDVLAAGVAHEVHLWDLRGAAGPSPLGMYGSAHTHTAPSYGSVRALAWHPCVPHTLLSGGDDGLVNIFNTAIAGEDDALVGVLCVGSAVASMGFFGPRAAYLWVVTEFDGLSLWNLGSAERVGDFPALRMQFLEAALPVCYLAGCHYHPASQRLGALAGGHDGTLRWCDVTPSAVTVAPCAAAAGAEGAFVASGAVAGHGNTVRCALWVWVGAEAGSASPGALPQPTAASEPGLLLFTGDEDGRLVQWADAVATARLASPATSALGAAPTSALQLAGEADYAAAHPAHALSSVHGIAMRLPPAAGSSGSDAPGGGSGGGDERCDADAFGATAADPVSDADDSVPMGSEVAALLRAADRGGGGGMEAEEVEEEERPPAMPAVALGKRRPVGWGEAMAAVLQAPDATKRARG